MATVAEQTPSVSERLEAIADPTDESTWARACAKCTRVLTAEEFGLHPAKKKRDGSPRVETLCPECRRGHSIDQILTKQEADKTAKIKEVMHQLTVAARMRRNPLPDMADICSGMIEQFGSIKEFCHEWHEQIQKSKGGSTTRLNQYPTIFKMIQVAAANQREEINMATATLEDLQAAMTKFVREEFQKLEELDDVDLIESQALPDDDNSECNKTEQ